MIKISRETDLELKNYYKKYGSLVYWRCVRYLGSKDDAWDATQEVFMKLGKSLGSIQKKEAIYSWLLSTSTNHCISELRKRRTIEFDELYHTDEFRPNESQDQKTAIRELISKLLSAHDQKIRQVVAYTYIDGYKQDEIAKLMGIGESTVRKYLTKFRRQALKTAHELEKTV